MGQPVIDARGRFETRDTRLAAALMAMGIRPMGSEMALIVTRPNEPGRRVQFLLAPVSECGKWKTVELVKAWRGGLAWVEKNPEHPFAYVMASHLQHLELLKYLNEDRRHVFLTRGKSVCLMPLDATLETEEKLLGRTDGKGWA